MVHNLRLLLSIIVYLTALNIIVPVQAQEFSPSRTKDEVVITFDDLPFVEVEQAEPEILQGRMNKLTEVITANQIPAIGFVNESQLFQRGMIDAKKVAILHNWLDAGLELGNHTYSHISLNQVSVEAFKEDIIHGESITKELLSKKGLSLRYFRYPYLHVGPNLKARNLVEGFLTERGYTIAPVTINNADWVFALAYNKARKKGDKVLMQRVATAYISHVEHSFEYAEKLALELFGFNISHVLVLHANSLNVDHFDGLVAMIKQRGYRFVSLEQALKHKAYRSLDTYAGPFNDSWLHHWLLSVGLRPPKAPEPPQFVRRLAGPQGHKGY